MFNRDFAVELLAWYQQHKRRLPWRETRDPYHVWLAETMLQQTQVETVIPYYHRWLKKFPILQSVAEAPIDDLLKYWEGLGYYRRCHHFHQAAQYIFKNHEGTVPQQWASFRPLPGVGDYTASAVLSIAFNLPLPAIDGNIRRVVARLLRKRNLTPYNQRIIKSKLQGWLDKERPGDFNQALMDLGTLVCRPDQAHCQDCPLTKYCQAYKTVNPKAYPRTIRRKPLPHYQVVAGIIWQGERFLIQRRPDKGLLGGLWEFPGGKLQAGETHQAALLREIREECQTEIEVLRAIGSARHAYTHLKITFTLFHCRLRDSVEIPQAQSRRWITPADVSRYAFPQVNHKLFPLLDQQGWHV